MIVYLSRDQILRIHAFQIERFGGLAGLRDNGGLEAAVARPRMTFGGEDLYPDVAAKAAALMHSLVMNHPFIDGNKRVGAHAALLFVHANGKALQISTDDLTTTTLDLARGELDREELTIWLHQRLRERER